MRAGKLQFVAAGYVSCDVVDRHATDKLAIHEMTRTHIGNLPSSRNDHFWREANAKTTDRHPIGGYDAGSVRKRYRSRTNCPFPRVHDRLVQSHGRINHQTL